jgi:hypothetical protein
MRSVILIKTVLALVSIVTTTILLAVLWDKCETYDPISFIEASLHQSESPSILSTSGSTWRDKIIVVPARDTDNVSWVGDELPE